MSEEMQRRLIMLFCDQCEGSKISDEFRAFEWRISLETLHETKETFLKRGFIDEQWNLVNWNKRQFLSDSSTDRVRKHREKQALKQDETLQKRPLPVTVTAPDTDTEADTEAERKKPSRGEPRAAKTKTQIADERHQDFKAAIKAYWESKNPGIDMPWGPSEGKQLGMWLREAPHINLSQFKEILRNRYKSDINHSERPCQWIRWITSFAGGPVDRYGKPANGGSNGRTYQTQPNQARQRVDNNRRAIAETLAARGVRGPWDTAGANSAPVSESRPGDSDAGVHGGLRAVGPEILSPEGRGRDSGPAS